MKLFLASEFGDTGDLLKEVYEIPPNPRVAYIPNAADDDEDKSWMEHNRDNFKKLGFTITDVDLRNVQGEFLRKELEKQSAIYIEGGNTFKLLDIARKSELDHIVYDLVVNHDTLYIGTSAGSIIAGPNIVSTKYLDDWTVVPDMNDFTSFNLVNFVVVPHLGNDEFYLENKDKYSELFKRLEDSPFAHICIRDNQAVWVDDDTMKILEL